MCSLLNMQFIMFTSHVDVFIFEHAVHNVYMQVQKWTNIHMLHDMVHTVILALKYTKTLKILMWTYAHYNVAMIRHITCSFSAANVRKMKKNIQFCMLPVQILYSMFEPLLAWCKGRDLPHAKNGLEFRLLLASHEWVEWTRKSDITFCQYRSSWNLTIWCEIPILLYMHWKLCQTNGSP